MSHDLEHGGGEWSFSKCIWSPTYKHSEKQTHRISWLPWDNILNVSEGDIILHLRKTPDKNGFIGFSIAASDGHITKERPPQPKAWGYCESFYRVILKDYKEFADPILLHQLFLQKKEDLVVYIKEKSYPKNVFYTLQSGKLQCLNGGYFTPVDSDLLKIIFDTNFEADEAVPAIVRTAEVWRQSRQRIGQQNFSNSVKKNYSNQCCFPGCEIDDKNFLIGAHIARWVDEPEKRGDISNGLCFCPVHDRAYEMGYFAIDNEYHIIANQDPRIQASLVFQKFIQQNLGEVIKLGEIKPAQISLREHRTRCKFE